MLVKLEVLGFDPGLWEGVEELSAQVLHWYYHEMHGQPMFSLNFGGTIGKREVLVLESVPDESRSNSGVTRTLDFGDEDADCTHRVNPGVGEKGNGFPQPEPVVEDEDISDHEWVHSWEDFCPLNSPGDSAALGGSFAEMPWQELGVYDEGEDTGS